MQDDLIQENIERVRDARITDLVTGAFQIFTTRLSVIAPAVTIIYLPVALYFAMYPATFPFSVSGGGELLIDETLLPAYYTEMAINLGILLYLVMSALAVAYVVELAVHGEQPELNNVIGHAFGRWGAGLRTGVAKMSLYLGTFLGAMLIGTFIATGLSALFGTGLGVSVGLGISLLIAAVPITLLTVMLVFDVYATSLREVAGRDALMYSVRVARGNWGQIVGVMLALILLVNVPLQLVQIGMAALGVADMPVVQVILMLLFNIIQAFTLTVYALIFLHFDYQKEEGVV